MPDPFAQYAVQEDPFAAFAVAPEASPPPEPPSAMRRFMGGAIRTLPRVQDLPEGLSHIARHPVDSAKLLIGGLSAPRDTEAEMSRGPTLRDFQANPRAARGEAAEMAGETVGMGGQLAAGLKLGPKPYTGRGGRLVTRGPEMYQEALKRAPRSTPDRGVPIEPMPSRGPIGDPYSPNVSGYVPGAPASRNTTLRSGEPVIDRYSPNIGGVPDRGIPPEALPAPPPPPKPKLSAPDVVAKLREQYGSERAGRMLYGPVQKGADPGSFVVSAAARKEAVKRIAPGESTLPSAARKAIDKRLMSMDPQEAFQYATKAPNAKAQAYFGERLKAMLANEKGFVSPDLLGIGIAAAAGRYGPAIRTAMTRAIERHDLTAVRALTQEARAITRSSTRTALLANLATEDQ